jgi:hypothetical protein
LIQVADEFCALNLGVAEVAPVELSVVVPEVTAAIVTCPTPVWIIVIEDPTG